MPDLDTREWLLTNGLGSFASGTISDVRTRTYHGWLFTATNPPSGRTLLFSHLDASLEVSGNVVALGTNVWGNGQIELTGYELLRCFDINPVPKWIWGRDNWQLSRQLVMPYGLVEAGDTSTSSVHRWVLGIGKSLLNLQSLIPNTKFLIFNPQSPIPNS